MSSIATAWMLVLATWVEYQFAFAKQGWVLITVLAMRHFVTGTWIRQTLARGIILLAAITSAALLHFFIHDVLLFCMLVLLITIMYRVWLAWTPLQTREWIIFAMVFVFASYLQRGYTIDLLQNQLLDVVLGTGGMLIVSVILTFSPLRLVFQQLVVRYLTYIHSLFKKLASERREQDSPLRFDLATTEAAEWIFAPGLSPHLRSGFRYYVLQLEHIIELLYIIQYELLRSPIQSDPELSVAFTRVMQDNQKRVCQLQAFFLNEPLVQSGVEATSDLDLDALNRAIENAYSQKMTPKTLDPYYLNLLGLLYDCEDLRAILSALSLALKM